MCYNARASKEHVPMRITVPVTINVDVEFDMTEEEAACYQDGQDMGLTNLINGTKRAIANTLHGSEGMIDEMVDAISDETGWCINGLTMETA
jgi:hypothetical protein